MLDLRKSKERKSKVKRILILLFFTSSFIFGQNTKLLSFGLKGRVKSFEQYVIDTTTNNKIADINAYKVQFNEAGFVDNLFLSQWKIKEKYIYDFKNNLIKINYSNNDSIFQSNSFFKSGDSINYLVEEIISNGFSTGSGTYILDDLGRISTHFYKQTNIGGVQKNWINYYSYDTYNQIIEDKRLSNDSIISHCFVNYKYLSFDKYGNWIKCIRTRLNSTYCHYIREYIVRDIEYY